MDIHTFHSLYPLEFQIELYNSAIKHAIHTRKSQCVSKIYSHVCCASCFTTDCGNAHGELYICDVTSRVHVCGVSRCDNMTICNGLSICNTTSLTIDDLNISSCESTNCFFDNVSIDASSTDSKNLRRVPKSARLSETTTKTNLFVIVDSILDSVWIGKDCTMFPFALELIRMYVMTTWTKVTESNVYQMKSFSYQFAYHVIAVLYMCLNRAGLFDTIRNVMVIPFIRELEFMFVDRCDVITSDSKFKEMRYKKRIPPHKLQLFKRCRLFKFTHSSYTKHDKFFKQCVNMMSDSCVIGMAAEMRVLHSRIMDSLKTKTPT
jgi:hypothetical protein